MLLHANTFHLAPRHHGLSLGRLPEPVEMPANLHADYGPGRLEPELPLRLFPECSRPQKKVRVKVATLVETQSPVALLVRSLASIF